MRLGFIFFIGVFTNLILASIFPYQMLPVDTANTLAGNDSYAYDFENSEFLTTNVKSSSNDLYTTIDDEEGTADLLATNQQESNFIESVSFFDGLTDALSKIGKYISLILPFGAVLLLLPGAIGIVFGGIYTAVIVFAIVRFIRGV